MILLMKRKTNDYYLINVFLIDCVKIAVTS